MNLTPEQQKVIHLTSGNHLVLAPPGTGKTEILTSRISYAAENNIDVKKMVCLTFTNRAAKEMKSRLSTFDNVGDLFVGNIHAFCVEFLKKNYVITNASLLLDEEERSAIIQEARSIALRKTADYIEGYFLNELSNLENKKNDNTHEKILIKANLQKFQSIKESFLKDDFDVKIYTLEKYVTFYKYEQVYALKKELNPFPEPLIRKRPIKEDVVGGFRYDYAQIFAQFVSETYEEIKNGINGIDFDDLIALTYNYLIKQEESNKYLWLQIDEVQDLNPLQWTIVNLITTDTAHKIYFGDYEQAIYSFLGAKLENLRKLENECEIHNFTKNFRSPGYLLEVYNAYALALLNPVWKKVPEPRDNVQPDKLAKLIREIDGYEEDELRYVIDKIIPNLPEDEVKAILVRANKSADILGHILSEQEISHFKISGFDIFKSSAVKLILAIMQVILDPLDRSSWIRIFYKYSNLKTLKQSRDFIIESFGLGIYPTDYINNDTLKLENFQENIINGRVVIFDTETTGLDTLNDDIIQIAGIELINGVIGKTFEVFIDTDKDLTESQKIHHISKETLIEKGIDRKEAFTKFLDFVNGDTLVAHNLKYDFEICNSNFNRVGVQFNSSTKFYDSIDLTKRIHPDLPIYKLEYLLKRLNIEGVNSHNALDDVKATANLIIRLFENTTELFAKRTYFLDENANTIKLFIEKFGQHYKDLYAKKNTETKLSTVFEEISSFINIDLPKDLHKITNYMDYISSVDILDNLLEKHILDFTTYKESDLITGTEKIIISTIHKAKGLGFDNVIITNCNANTYPHPYSNNRDEDARLFYVGLSRAKKRIILTYYNRISRFWVERVNKTNDNGKSYTEEVEHEYVETSGSQFLKPILPYFGFKKVIV